MRPEQDPDPVVTRVRRAREALARACDYDFQKMFEFLKSRQAQHPDRARAPKRPGVPRLGHAQT